MRRKNQERKRKAKEINIPSRKKYQKPRLISHGKLSFGQLS